MEDTEPKKKKKGCFIVIGVLVLLAIIGAIFSGGDKNEPQPVQSTSQSEPKEWTTVLTLSGSGSKKSALFELQGGDAKIKYSYKGQKGLGIGAFNVYVVEEGVDLMKDGGFPETSVDAESEDGESALHKSAGKYYIDVEASGKWTVEIHEKR